MTFNLRGGLLAALAASLTLGMATGASATHRHARHADLGAEHGCAKRVHCRHHHHAHRHHHVTVHAPYTTVGRRAVTVAAPYADVRVRRGRGIHVAAPFVDVRVAR